MKDSLTITYKINGKINSSGYYKDGLPYTGTFKKGSKIIAFKNGQQIEKPLVTEDTIFHYSSDNFIKTSYPSKEVVKVFGLASQMEDTTIHIGYKKFDSPFNGTFVDNSSLRSYKDGKLHGKEMKFRELSEPPYYVVNYENGEKDGQAEVMLFDSMFIGTYRADIPYEGSFYIRKKGKGRTKHCILTYKDGQITGDSIIKSDISHISYKNGLPYTGYFPYPNQKEYYERFMLVFHNGIKKQLITLGDGRRDTLFKTYYEHSKSYTKDNNGIIIRETEFLSNKKSGKTIFYPIEEKSIYSIQFRNDTIQNGTYYEILDKETRLGPSSENTHGFSKLFFKNGLLQSYETHFEVDKFYSKYILDNPFPVTLPFVYQPFNFNRNWSGVVEFYDKKTNQYICEFRQKGLYKGYFGIKIERRKNAYFLRQYEDTNQKHFLDNIPWSQLKKKVDEIK